MPLLENDMVTIHHWPESATLHVHWNTFHDSAKLRASLTEAVDLVRKHRIKHWIADTKDVASPMRKDDQQWIAEQGPAFVQAGLQAIITVVPNSALAKLSNKGWQKKVDEINAGFVMEEVATLDQARDLVAAVRKRAA